MEMELKTSYWPADTAKPVLELTAGDLLRRAASRAPDRTALIETMPDGTPSLTGAAQRDRRWSYTQLLRDAEACAQSLLARFQPGQHICLWAPNVPEWVIVQYGAALAGLVLVTANPALRAEELRHVLRRSKAAALIHVEAFRGSDMSAIARQVGDAVGETILLGDLVNGSDAPGEAELPSVSPDSAAQIQFTSGTTGLPKGALLRHRGLVTNAAFLAERMGQNEDIVVTPMPLFHTAGSVLSVLGAAASLSTLVLPTVFDPQLMLSAAVKERATVVSGVPTMLSAMLQVLETADHDLSRVKVLLSGGSPVPPELHRRVEAAFGCPLVTLFGQTELSPAICATAPDDRQEDRALTCGRPLPQVEVRIADPATGETVAVGVDGEVQARGYQVMAGYFGQPEATGQAILPDGWLRTGDLGHIDERGFIRITGRLSDMIIRGGENLYPAEIEAALARHPTVVEAAVFGLPDPHWGEIVAAALRLRQDSGDVGAAALKRHCRELLAPHKSPTRWFSIDALPLTASGKVQKFVLRDAAQSGQLRPID